VIDACLTVTLFIEFVLTVALANDPDLMFGNTMRGDVNVGSHKVRVGATVAQIRSAIDGVTATLVMIRTGSTVASTSVTGAGAMLIRSR
jgi:hypothetical protein